MRVKRESAMGMKDSGSFASGDEKGSTSGRVSKKRKGNVLLHGQRKLVSRGRAAGEDNKFSMGLSKGFLTKKGCKRISVKEEAPSVRLVKIELDAAEALAEFSRIALLPTQYKSEEDADTSLQWFGKRKRSTRINKGVGSGEAEKDAMMVDDQTSKKAFIPSTTSTEQIKVFSSQVGYGRPDGGKGSFSTVERDELEDNRTFPESSKESLPSDSRAESPSSPLLSSQLECRTFLIGGPAKSSAFQRVVPVRPIQKGCRFLTKTKMEDIQIDVPCFSAVPAHKMTVKRKPRASKPAILSASVKLEQFGDTNSQASSDQHIQDIVRKNIKDTKCQSLTRAESGVESLLDPASQVVESSRDVELRGLNKQKTPLTETEKEERRLRRIQANRESARQTIRRKQILCEELTKKATSLTLENEEMKQKKDVLMQELYSLKDQNCHLKEQVAMQSSSNFGLDSFQQACKKASQEVSLPVLPVPVLPYAGMPLQSFVWALAVAQATAANQTSILQNGEMVSGMKHNLGANDTSSLWLGPGGTRQSQLPAFLFPHPSCMAVSNRVSTSGVPEQQITDNSNVSCSPTPAQKEASSVSEDCVESSALQNTRTSSECQEDCDGPNLDVTDAQLVSESVNGADLVKNSTCHSQKDAGLPSQPVPALHASSLKSQACKSAFDKGCGSSIASAKSGHCLGNVTQQLTQALSSYGIPSNGSRIGVALEGSLHTSSFIGRKTSAASIAAAEARRRRKELTRSKFLQARAFRLHC